MRRQEVIETVPFDLIMNFGVGLATAWTAREEIRLSKGIPWRPLLALLAFEVLVFCPLGAYLYLVHPDWSWNYFLDPRALPGWVGILAVGGYAALAAAGFAVGVLLVRRGSAHRLLQAVGVVAALLAAYFAVFFQRFLWVGRFADYQAGPAAPAMQPLFASRLGWVLLVAGECLLGALGWMLVHFERHGRRLRA